MTRCVALRPQVPDDLAETISFLEQRGTDLADRFLDAVFAAFEQLAATPGMGSPKHFRSVALAGVRSWPIPGFPNY